MLKTIKFLLIINLLCSPSVFASINFTSNSDWMTEQKTYQQFKENFLLLISLAGQRGHHLSQEENVTDAYWACLYNQQLETMLKNNQKYQVEFDQEFAKRQGSFDDALKGFGQFNIEMASYCTDIKAQYESKKNLT